ncbi:outer membrane beta-barrel protein [Dyella marensis]|jgi:opacity protein-like surface antigen|uniref:Outer membrane protein beta-barrel domain-containing protein n=1 Tax=Dyella marensis TaxID=500610 RepID=A0A1I2IHB5_9GAMM|nr:MULTISPECIES: outer membrane beta-barrel protein [Dyella]SFF41053.1 Outer membrane protein beta-barrel domain-containing protein [Dyella marensis]
MKFKSTAFVAAAVFAAASPCVTQAAEQSSRKERHGAYLFGDIGSASVQAAALQARVPGGKALKKSTSSALGYGFGVGYRFGDHFALEGGYRGMSGANVPMLPAADGRAQGRKFRTNGLQISALGIIPLGQHFELYGRASLAYMQNKFGPIPRQAQPPKAGARRGRSSSNLSDSMGIVTFGLGAQYHVNDKLAIRGEIGGLSAAGKKIERAAGGRKLCVGQATLGLVYRLD